MSTNRKLYLFLGTIIGGVGVVNAAMADDCDIARDSINTWDKVLGCTPGVTICGDYDYTVICDGLCQEGYPDNNSCEAVCTDTIEAGCAGAWCNFSCDGGGYTPPVPPDPETNHCGYYEDGDGNYHKCSKGRFCDNSGGCSDECDECDFGTYARYTGQCTCTPCPVFYYGGTVVRPRSTTNKIGATSLEDCYISSGNHALASEKSDTKGYYSSINLSRACYGSW